MQITKQLAVFLENRSGTLARLCEALAEEQINIHAMTMSDTVDYSVIRLVLDDPQRALHLFEAHGTLVVEDDVLLVDSANRPGELAHLCRQLSEADISIEYCYCASCTATNRGLVVFRLSDPAAALGVLNSSDKPSRPCIAKPEANSKAKAKAKAKARTRAKGR